MAKIADKIEKISETVTEGYQKIEDAATRRSRESLPKRSSRKTAL